MKCALISFAATTVAIDYEGALAEKLLDLLLRRVARAADGDTPKITLTLREEVVDEGAVLRLDGALIVRSHDPGELAEHLHEHIAYHFADGCHEGLIVHASAVALDGHAMLFPAASGSGKSTLCTHLVSRGFSHMTDELAHIAGDAETLSGWMRPIEIKHGSIAIVEPMLAPSKTGDTWLPTSRGRIIAPELLGVHANTSIASAKLRAVVFPRFVKDQAGYDLRPLSAAETSSLLLQCTVNARNLPRHGLSLAAESCRRSKGFALSYGSFDGLEALLREQLVADVPHGSVPRG